MNLHMVIHCLGYDIYNSFENIMNVFWAGSMTGKQSLGYQHLYGNKSIAFCHTYVIRKKYATVHLTGYKGFKKFWDATVTNELYHKRIDEDKVRIASMTERKLQNVSGGHILRPNIYYSHKPKCTNFYIEPLLHKYGEYKPTEVKMDKKDYIKYSRLKYSDTMAYYKAINASKTNNIANVLEEIKPENYPDVHTIVPNFRLVKNNEVVGEVYEPISNWFEDKKNIVPYKSNVHDLVVKLLDGFADYRSGYVVQNLPDKPCNIVEIYKNEKEMVYFYLDEEVINKPKKLVNRFKHNNIKFEHFDLDKGSYKDTFGLDRDFDRNYDNSSLYQLKITDNKKDARKRYFELLDLADEYIRSRKVQDTRYEVD